MAHIAFKLDIITLSIYSIIFTISLCKVFPWICDNVLEAIMGPSVNTNTSRLPYYLTYEPNPTSVQNIIHWYCFLSSSS